MGEEYDEDYLSDIKGLMDSVAELKASVAGTNVEVDGIIHSSDTLMLHELIKMHKLMYNIDTTPPGKFSWTGLRPIKNTKDNNNPAFKLPDNMATFYGSLEYDYALKTSDGTTKPIRHDVVSMSPVILDAQSRNSTKTGTGVYGVDWFQVYMPVKLLRKLSKDITTATGYVVGDDGVIVDSAQDLASITINCRNVEDSPSLTMIAVTTEGEAPSDTDVVEKVTTSDMGTMAELMADGGENDLIGGLGFFSIGVSCKFMAGTESPPAGTVVKLSLKMKAFHALNIIDGGIKRITYKSKTSGLKY